MRDLNFIDEQRNADLLDAMADIVREQEEAMRLDDYLTQVTDEILADAAYQQEQAMRESEAFEWDGIEEISSAERNACDHYNERYVIND